MTIIKGHILRKRIPIFVVLCVTNRCNLNCSYCYEASYDRNQGEFTTKQILNLIDDLAKMGTKYIAINGGEALLRKDIELIVDRIRQRNILSHLSTNGTFLRKHISVLKKIDSIAISIDGTKESNDANRGKGTYDKIIESMKYLRNERIKFHTHTVLTKRNINAVDEIMPLAQKYGFKAQFSPLREDDSLDKSIGFNDLELKQIVEKILQCKKKGYPIFFSFKTYEHFLSWPFSYKQQIIREKIPPGYKPVKCHIKKFSCHIEANGLVYPCIVLVNRSKALNFLDVGFRTAWKNLENTRCKACTNICCNDLNLLFSFNYHSFFNALRIVFDRLTNRAK